MQLQPQNFEIAQNLDGTIDGAFPNGDKSPTLIWNNAALPSFANKSVGSSQSFNAQALLTGTGASQAVISLVAVSGGGIGGWSVQPDGDTVAITSPAAGIGQFALQATYLNAVVTSAPISWSFVAVTGSAVKFHALTHGSFYGYSDATSYAGTLAATTAFLKRTDIQNIAGVQVYFRVSEMEATQGAPYTALFAKIDNLIALCNAAGKKLAFGVWERGFGTSDGTSNGMSPPPYMKGGTAATGAPAGSNAYTCWAAQGASFGGVNSLLNYGSSTCLNDIIALYQAIGDRYNNNPTVECFIWFGETALSPSGTSPTGAALIAAMVQIANAIAPHWANTLIRLETNFCPGVSNSNMTTLLGLADTLPNYIPGGPDPVITPPGTGFNTTANTYFTGNGGGTTGANRRGKNPWWSEVQTDGMGGANNLFPGGSGTGAALGASTAKAMIDAQAAAGAYYFTVNFNDNTDTVQFNRDMLPYINQLGGKLQSALPTVGTWNQG